MVHGLLQRDFMGIRFNSPGERPLQPGTVIAVLNFKPIIAAVQWRNVAGCRHLQFRQAAGDPKYGNTYPQVGKESAY